MSLSLFVLLVLIYPAAAIYCCLKSSFMNKIGVVILCYLAGILIGNGFSMHAMTALQNSMAEALIAFALPLLLFSLDVKQWSRIAGKALLSMLLAFVSIGLVSLTAYFFIKVYKPDTAWQLAGLSVGVYTGGTPNIAAIKTALSVDNITYILFHTYDTIVSLIFLIFVVSIAQRIFNRVLTEYKPVLASSAGMETESAPPDIHGFANLCSLSTLSGLVPALIAACITVVAAAVLSTLVPPDYSAAAAILVITSLGIAGSLIKKLNATKQSFESGMYLIYCFCVVVGSMTDFKALMSIDFPILVFVGFCVFGSMMVHALFCRVFRIDTDTFLITSTSAICSPPFVPMVAGALKNRDIILSGLTTGIIGFAAGNYLGITTAYIIRILFEN